MLNTSITQLNFDTTTGVDHLIPSSKLIENYQLKVCPGNIPRWLDLLCFLKSSLSCNVMSWCFFFCAASQIEF